MLVSNYSNEPTKKGKWILQHLWPETAGRPTNGIISRYAALDIGTHSGILKIYGGAVGKIYALTGFLSKELRRWCSSKGLSRPSCSVRILGHVTTRY